jgi:hypothetical protein
MKETKTHATWNTQLMALFLATNTTPSIDHSKMVNNLNKQKRQSQRAYKIHDRRTLHTLMSDATANGRGLPPPPFVFSGRETPPAKQKTANPNATAKRRRVSRTRTK